MKIFYSISSTNIDFFLFCLFFPSFLIQVLNDNISHAIDIYPVLEAVANFFVYLGALSSLLASSYTIERILPVNLLRFCFVLLKKKETLIVEWIGARYSIYLDNQSKTHGFNVDYLNVISLISGSGDISYWTGDSYQLKATAGDTTVSFVFNFLFFCILHSNSCDNEAENRRLNWR